MAEYNGFFVFVNDTGHTIKSGTAKHYTTDYGTQAVQLDNLAPHCATVPVPFRTSSGNRDHWNVSCTLDNGKQINHDHACGFESEDNTYTVILQLLYVPEKDKTSLLMRMPRSSSCTDP